MSQRPFDEAETHRQLRISCGCLPVIGATLAPIVERIFFGRSGLGTTASLLLAAGVVVGLSVLYFVCVFAFEWWQDRK